MAKKSKAPEAAEEVVNQETVTEEVTDEVTSHEAEKIAELEKELAASKEAHMRTLAEYDNYRKRSVREREGTYTDAKAACIGDLLPVLDNFERALSVTESDFTSFKKGTEMIYTELCETLKKLGVETFGEAGESFDPNYHNGVMHIEDDSMGENVIAQVFSKGYKIGEKVLRPAMVQVAN